MAAKAEGAVARPAPGDSPPDAVAGSGDSADHRTAKETEEEQEQEEEKEEGREEPRGVKRRRTCPAALEKFSSEAADGGEEYARAGLEGAFSFSFSFDTQGVAPIGITPKFGSFNSSATADLGSGAAEEQEKRASDGNKLEAEGVKEEVRRKRMA